MRELKYYGYVLLMNLEQYNNTKEKLLVKCSCGGETCTTLSNFKRMKGCKNCNNRNAKKDYMSVNDFFAKHGCKLLTDEVSYNNTFTKVSYICKCGRRSIITAHSFFCRATLFRVWQREKTRAKQPLFQQRLSQRR